MATSIDRNQKAFKQVWKSVTGIPAENFEGDRYTAVTFNAEGTIDQAELGQYAIGILEEPNDIGEPAQVVAQGFMFVEFGAAVTAGQMTMVGANGRIVPYAAATEGTNYPLGIAQVGGALGDIGTVLLK